jgi:hypothetical protein
VTHTSSPRPFDERAALQELERLAEKIQATRRQRQEAVAEFESFVKTFRDDRYSELVAKDAARPLPTVPERRMPEAFPAPPIPQPAVAAPREPEVSTPPVPRAAVDDDEPIVPMARPRVDPLAWLSKSPRQIAAAAIGALALGAFVVWLFGGFGTSDAPDTTPSTVAPASRSETPAPAAGGPQPVASTGPAGAAPVPAPPRALNIELITSRPVWTRVIVDDQKVIERELPKDSRIPLSADRAIAIRAGDAGAIRLTVAGKDAGVLGRDGQIAARTLTAPPSPRR